MKRLLKVFHIAGDAVGLLLLLGGLMLGTNNSRKRPANVKTSMSEQPSARALNARRAAA